MGPCPIVGHETSWYGVTKPPKHIAAATQQIITYHDLAPQRRAYREVFALMPKVPRQHQSKPKVERLPKERYVRDVDTCYLFTGIATVTPEGLALFEKLFGK